MTEVRLAGRGGTDERLARLGEARALTGKRVRLEPAGRHIPEPVVGDLAGVAWGDWGLQSDVVLLRVPEETGAMLRAFTFGSIARIVELPRQDG
jgi:hypothetical protein